ncbi:MAG: cyclic nucleotide-binding domain-containing protein [Candidatus Dormibacteraeota bacterium]|nr:cyclic nucleotide-binding domain-containing protein [Candidatus Dormibacteraeota bacterium]
MIHIPHRSVNPKISELKQLEIFGGLSPALLRTLASNLDEVTIPKGEKFVTEGRSNDTFFVILEGQVELTVARRVHEVLKRGDVIGLPSMFTRLDSTADAVAKIKVRALVASHRQFNSLVSNPEIEIRFKAATFDRLRDEVYQLTHSPARARATAAKKAGARKAGAKTSGAKSSPIKTTTAKTARKPK